MRMNWSLYVVAASAALMLSCPAVSAQGTKRPVSRDARFYTLRPENAFPEWRRLAIEGGARPTESGIGYAQLSSGDPLGSNTAEATSGFWLPLSNRLSSLVE